MNSIRLLIKLLLLAGLVGGGGYMVYQRNTDKTASFQETVQDTQDQLLGAVKGISNSAGQQTKDLADRSQEVLQHSNQVLGDYIQPAEDNDSQDKNDSNPVYEETFEYGRYLYCQQVIEDYESENPN